MTRKEHIIEAGFPILKETTNYIVYSNSSDEIFIQLKNVDVGIRISDSYDVLKITTLNRNRFTPWQTNGLPAIVISK